MKINTKDIVSIINTVINDSNNFSQYMLNKDYGITQSNISMLRAGKRDVGNLSLNTVIKIIDAYNDKMYNNNCSRGNRE